MGGFLFTLAGPAGAVNYTIDNSQPAGGNNYYTLQGLHIADSDLSGDQITFLRGTPGSLDRDRSLTSQFTLTNGATLTLVNSTGGAFTIASNAGGSRFLSASGDATINWGTGLTFSGFAAATGGGALVVGGDLTGGIANSTFTGNQATNGSGGAVSVGGGLDGGIANSTFTGNAAVTRGAVFVWGSLTGGIANSTFTGNQATNGSGGAVSVGNGLDGGITNSTFTDNTATNGNGGAVAVGGDLTGGITNSTFTDNTATNGNGGAVYVFSNLTGGISGSTFENNTATNGNGGAVYVFSNLTGGISGSTFENNTANAGGAVYVFSNLTGGISGSTFENNTATNSFGGAVLVSSGLAGGITNSTFENNTVTNGSGGAVSVGNGLDGGIANSTFENNTATNGNGGAVFVGNGLTGGITNSTFTGNTATNGFGGAGYLFGDITGGISGSTFTGNAASFSGGALYLGGNVDISGADAQFLGNKAVYTAINTSSGQGGAIFHEGGQNPGDPDKTFKLSATPGAPIVFSGNTHNPDNAGATPNSIYFGNSRTPGEDGQVTATFAVAAGGGLLMWDPLASQPDDLDYVDGFGPGTYANLSLTINKTGPGTWVLAGTSDMRSATNWTVSEGALHLVADAAGAPAHIKLSNTTNKLGVANPASFTLKNGASLLLEPTSAAHQITGRKITLESGSNVGVAGFQYGPKLDPGKHTVLTLTAPTISNASGLVATSGDIVVGVNSYKYSGLAWDGHNLVMSVGQGAQNPIMAGVPAVTGSGAIGFQSLQGTFNTLYDRALGMFHSLNNDQIGGATQPTYDIEEVSAAEGSAVPTSAPGAGETEATRYRAADQPNRIWFTPYYSSTSQSGAGNVGYDLDTPGVALGFERLICDRAFAGLAFTVNWPTYEGGGTDIDATNFTLALYGGGILPFGNLEVDGRIGYGWTDYEQTRRVAAPGVPQQRYDSDYDGQMFFAGLGLGRTFGLDNGFWLRPGASYDYIHLSTDGFDEGDGLLSLSVDDYDQDLHRVKAGLEAGWESEAGFTASAEAYYLGLYGDNEAETSGHFVADPANGFAIIGNGLDENSLGLGAKIGLPLGPNWDLSVGYDFLVGSDATTHQGSATVTFRF